MSATKFADKFVKAIQKSWFTGRKVDLVKYGELLEFAKKVKKAEGTDYLSHAEHCALVYAQIKLHKNLPSYEDAKHAPTREEIELLIF